MQETTLKILNGASFSLFSICFQIMYRFPESLQSEIRLYLNHSLFDQFDIFEGVSEGCLRALASVFRIEVFPRQHYLIKEGDVVTKLFFIVSGSVNVMDGNQCGKCLGKINQLAPAV